MLELEILISVLGWFRGQSTLRQLGFFVGVLVVSVGLWNYDYRMRYAKNHADLKYVHDEFKARYERCERFQLATSFSKECAEAHKESKKNIELDADILTWQGTHVCGGNSCTDMLFGKDSTLIGISARLMICALLITGALVGVRLIRNGTRFFDAFMKKRAVMRHELNDYNKPDPAPRVSM